MKRRNSMDFEEILARNLPEPQGMQAALAQAMRYSVFTGGKRIRPRLMQAAFAMFGGQGQELAPFLSAMEMLHTYSLVHDDLPALDHDTLRRGRETTWHRYGECMGILAGDGLLHHAFETAAAGVMHAAHPERAARAMYVLAQKSGVSGMLGGQAFDTAQNGAALSAEELLMLYEKKTAALISASLMIGAILAGADDRAVSVMEQVGIRLGIAFQIRDDLLDCADAAGAGGSDERNCKTTYVTLFGAQAAEDAVQRYSEEAIALLRDLPADSTSLQKLIRALAVRQK